MHSCPQFLVYAHLVPIENSLAEWTHFVSLYLSRKQHLFTCLADGVLLLAYENGLAINRVVPFLANEAVQLGFIQIDDSLIVRFSDVEAIFGYILLSCFMRVTRVGGMRNIDLESLLAFISFVFVSLCPLNTLISHFYLNNSL